MTIRLDDANIRVTVDTETAKKALQDIDKQHKDLQGDREEGDRQEKKKKKAGKKAGKVGFMRARIQGGTARARAFLARQAPYTGVPVVAIVAGAIVAIQRYIAPFIGTMVAENLKDILPDFIAQDKEIDKLKKELLDTLDKTVGEAVAQIQATMQTTSSTLDFVKKVTIMAGEVPEGKWEFAKGVHGWNSHMSRMRQMGPRIMSEQSAMAMTRMIDTFGGTIMR